MKNGRVICQKSKHLSVALTLVLIAGCQSTSTSVQVATTKGAEGQQMITSTAHAPRVALTEPNAPVALAAHKDSLLTEAAMTRMPAPQMLKYATHHAVELPSRAEPYNERYQATPDNPVLSTASDPVSTFGIDVDTGSYSNVRRILNEGRLPPKNAVRSEEFINYFGYEYAQPTDGRPFAVHTAVLESPYKAGAKLLHIGIKAKEMTKDALPPANLVLLVDVSGSMSQQMVLVKQTLRQLVAQLRPQDRATLITYASGEQVVMPVANMNEANKKKLIDHINALRASGGTSGERAIQLAYQQAQAGYIKDGINRILLLTDGDFNVGVSDFETLKSMVAEKRQSGISLSTFGYGTGNYHEVLMEQIADAGDGNYSYIDSAQEATKVLNRQLTSTLATVAQDVKVQVEFNPRTVKEYRLIGYQNRLLGEADFSNDNVDSGDIGAGHTVTAIYEIVPVGETGYLSDRRYSDNARGTASSNMRADEYAHVALRYKLPDQTQSVQVNYPIAKVKGLSLDKASTDARFSVAVASFAEILSGGKYKGQMTYDDVIALAKSAQGQDKDGTRAEFVELAGIAKSLSAKHPQSDD